MMADDSGNSSSRADIQFAMPLAYISRRLLYNSGAVVAVPPNSFFNPGRPTEHGGRYMYVYIYIYIYIYIYMHMHVHIYINVDIHMSVHMYIHACMRANFPAQSAYLQKYKYTVLFISLPHSRSLGLPVRKR